MIHYRQIPYWDHLVSIDYVGFQTSTLHSGMVGSNHK